MIAAIPARCRPGPGGTAGRPAHPARRSHPSAQKPATSRASADAWAAVSAPAPATVARAAAVMSALVDSGPTDSWRDNPRTAYRVSAPTAAYRPVCAGSSGQLGIGHHLGDQVHRDRHASEHVAAQPGAVVAVHPAGRQCSDLSPGTVPVAPAGRRRHRAPRRRDAVGSAGQARPNTSGTVRSLAAVACNRTAPSASPALSREAVSSDEVQITRSGDSAGSGGLSGSVPEGNLDGVGSGPEAVPPAQQAAVGDAGNVVPSGPTDDLLHVAGILPLGQLGLGQDLHELLTGPVRDHRHDGDARGRSHGQQPVQGLARDRPRRRSPAVGYVGSRAGRGPRGPGASPARG